MTIPLITSTVSNPFTGTFGNGVIVPFLNSGTFVVPAGVNSVRVRVWGAGGHDGGGGGGFTMRTIAGLISGASIAVTVGAGAASGSVFGGTSSFGSFCSATGGGSGSTSPARGGGVGTGGDINTTGGAGGNNGGGVAGMWGNGGSGASTNGAPGNSGGGGSNTAGNYGGSGIYGTGAQYQSSTVFVFPTTGFISASIDFIGTGGGGAFSMSGVNGGGGGGSSGAGGFPGGGSTGAVAGGKGLVIVEY
jgi:hypothetical protein